ncbi:MAG: GGDEF domain-containing protein [Gemmatimonadales bacterium]|jgi:two-component system cell cycle response regulator
MTKDDPDRTRVGGFPGLAEYLKSHVESRTGCLTLIQGHEADLGKHLVLQDRVVIGRSSECDLVIGDLQASRQHCDISVRADGSYAIRDLGSTNGTQVGTLPLEGSVSLRDGDKVFIGETVLRFFLADDIDLEFAGQVGYLLGTDALTGLQSKRKFDHRLELSLRVAARRGECLSVLMMDLDGLKRINDRHGHLFGAYSIQETGKLIARVLGKRGEACRFGGDEFTAFLPRHDARSAGIVAEEIRVELEGAGLEREAVPLKPTLSIGVASFPDDGTDLIQLIAAADEALYRAKASGKNRVCTT